VITLEINVEGAVRKFELATIMAEDLEEPLTRFAKYWFARTKAHYEAQNFAPLAQSTIDKRAQAGLRTLERRLKRETKKARDRAMAATGKRSTWVASVLGLASATAAAAAAIAGQTRGVRNREAVLAALQAKHRGKRKGGDDDVVKSDQVLTLKQSQSLAMRVVRAVSRSINRKILGALDKSTFVEVRGDAVTLMAETAKSWSEAQNDGGTVGHGAVLPKREAIMFEPHDEAVLISILKDHLLLPFQEGMQGPGY
jgi:hypothetical protein